MFSINTHKFMKLGSEHILLSTFFRKVLYSAYFPNSKTSFLIFDFNGSLVVSVMFTVSYHYK